MPVTVRYTIDCTTCGRVINIVVMNKVNSMITLIDALREHNWSVNTRTWRFTCSECKAKRKRGN
jgi:hypothetical protein